MSSGERTGTRDLTYSGWHREDNLRRRHGLTRYQAWALRLIDIDGCEYCGHCKAPLALLETQVSEKDPKPAEVTARLARAAGIPAWSVSVLLDDAGDVGLFRLRQIEPPAVDVLTMLPRVYAYWLYSLRVNHGCIPESQAE